MKREAGARQVGGAERTTSAARRAADLAGFQKGPGADRSGSVRRECFT